ncbi:MAG: hypothetical protein NC409_00965 [Clostridium sp.]|nr:hypothetical protein [Clostridium sp.]
MSKKDHDDDYHIHIHTDSDGSETSPLKELGLFLGGLAMLVAGLFFFSQKVLVYSSFFSTGFAIRGFHMRSGMVIVPLIIGIVWLFAAPKSFAAKLFMGAAALIIIAAVIMSTDFHLLTMTLFDWILLLVLIFGGLGMVLRVLLTKH